MLIAYWLLAVFDQRVQGHVPCGPDPEVVAWRASWAPKAVHKPGGTRTTPVKRAVRRQGIAKWALHPGPSLAIALHRSSLSEDHISIPS